MQYKTLNMLLCLLYNTIDTMLSFEQNTRDTTQVQIMVGT